MIERAAAGRQRRTERRICPCFAMPEAMRSPPKVTIPERSKGDSRRSINARAWRCEQR
jgi:hypothetical protein